MPTAKEIFSDYKLSLDILQAMARRDLLASWKGVQGEAWMTAKAELVESFANISREYGQQAAASAADYVFLERSLDDDLSLMAYPQLPEPVDLDRARASARWALRKVTAEQRQEDIAAAQSKLEQISTRLMLHPVRELLRDEAERENAFLALNSRQRLKAERLGILKPVRFVSLPSPGACAWCLLISAKGEVFHEDGVGGYHDGCRCLPMLTREGERFPKIISEIEALWAGARELPGYEEHMAEFRKEHPNARDWYEWHEELKFAVEQRRRYLREFQEFPDIPGITVPEVDFTQVTFRDSRGKMRTIEAPKTHQLPGHVLYGWRSDESWRGLMVGTI